jgi:hypothetical protein
MNQETGPAVINLPPDVDFVEETGLRITLKFGTLADRTAFLLALREARKDRSLQHEEYGRQHGLREDATAAALG